MNDTLRYFTLLLCLGVSACGGDDSKNGNASVGGNTSAEPSSQAGRQEAGSPSRPDRQVYLSPADVSTAVPLNSLELWVDGSILGDVGDAKLEELSRAIGLITWPEMTDIGFQLTAVDASKAGDKRAHVTITPAEPFQSRWYALYVKSLPTGFQWWNAPESRAEKIARFRVDSMPVIRAVVRCRKGGDSLAVYLSQMVGATEAQKISVEGASCVPVVGGAQSVDRIDLSCTVDEAADGFTFTFGETLPVRADKAAWTAVDDGCTQFIPHQLEP